VAARLRGLAASAALALLLASGCVTGPGGGGPAGQPAPATPMRSLSPAVTGTVAGLQATLARAGYRIDILNRAYRPAEPVELSGIPRAVLQADVGDLDGGYVVVYEFADAAAAASRGQLFARYLASGFGQTNYPLDAQFALQQAGPTLVFTWWSRELAASPDRAQGAFDLISSFAVPIEIRK
jgi:hypothetical protein